MQKRKMQDPQKLAPLSAVRLLNISGIAFLSIFLLRLMAEGDFQAVTFRMLLLTICAGVPGFLFALPAGYTADRLPKRFVVVLSSIAHFLVICLAPLLFRLLPEIFACPLVLGLIFTVQTFFIPAFYALLPEIFTEDELSRANGIINARSFFGIIAGLALGWTAYYLPGHDLAAVFYTAGALAVLEFIFALRIKFTHTAVRQDVNVFHGLRDLGKKPSVLLAALGENFFLAIGTVLPFLILLRCQDLPAGKDALSGALLLLAPLIGFAAGSRIAGRLSLHKIEPGLIPFGALGVALTLFFAARLPGPFIPFTIKIPHVMEMESVFALGTILLLFASGVSGGLFVIPLRTYLQQRLTAQYRGSALAMNNAIACLFQLTMTGLVFAFLADALSLFLRLPAFLEYFPRCSAGFFIAVLGFITFLVTLFSMWILPEFALRFIIISIGNTFYKTQITGAENIPERGPALLISNHVSFTDGILISACTSRRIRFLMRDDLFANPLLRFVAKLTSFIRVPPPGKHKDVIRMFRSVQEALRNGEIICVFPEERETRNSLLGEFKSGFRRMIPDDLPDLPLIPVCISGMWGSKYSHYGTLKRPLLALRKRHCASVTFGKDMGRDVTAFQVRHRIAELQAQTYQFLPRPGEVPLHTRLAMLAKKHPFRILMREGGSEKTRTAFELLLDSLVLNRMIRKRTDGEDVVGVLLPNSILAAESILAIQFADKTPCVLNYTTPADVLKKTIAKGGIRHIFTNRAMLEKLQLTLDPDLKDMMICHEDLDMEHGRFSMMISAMFLPVQELMNLVSPLSCADVFRPAIILFSSGSTGVPKGAVLTHHSINTNVYAINNLLMPDPRQDGVLGNLPLFHSFGMNVCFWMPVSTGTPVTYLANPLDGRLAGETIARDALTFLFATPSFLQTYLRKCKPEQFDTLRFVMTGAEKLRAETLAHFREFVKGRLTITEGYGCTELSPVVSINVPEDIAGLGRMCGPENTIGASLETVASKVVDPITFRTLPPDTEGLLFVSGPLLMQGYLNEPDLTAKVIRDGYYNTGDVVTMQENGTLSICGRLSRFSKIAGEMVPHEMVEGIINELCNMPQRVVAVGSIPDEKKGEALLVLYTPETPMTPDEIVAELRERSISNLWIPKAANFHPVEKLPLLGSGKLDLSLLRTMADRIAAERK